MENYLFLKKFLKNNQKLLVIVLFGLILISFGVLIYKIDLFSSGDSVEVITPTTEPQDNTSEIVVEISGSVEKPAVYKLPNGSRINDLLTISGGLSSNADREWLDKNINKASKLVDGQKIYIYHSGELSAKDSSGIKLDQQVLGTINQNLSNLVNVNTGSQLELEKLVGIGPVYALNIIEHRPYSNVEELVSKGAISQKILEKIKNAITVY